MMRKSKKFHGMIEYKISHTKSSSIHFISQKSLIDQNAHFVGSQLCVGVLMKCIRILWNKCLWGIMMINSDLKKGAEAIGNAVEQCTAYALEESERKWLYSSNRNSAAAGASIIWLCVCEYRIQCASIIVLSCQVISIIHFHSICIISAIYWFYC